LKYRRDKSLDINIDAKFERSEWTFFDPLI